MKNNSLLSYPLVSVVIPSYKRPADMVERAVRSVLSQTYPNIEVVLVDDNAKPGLISYREALKHKVKEISDSRVILIVNEQNLGGSGARNVGIAASKGEYISFLDDDDVYLPEKVEKQLETMLKEKWDVSFTNLSLYDENDTLVDVRTHDIKRFDLERLRKYHLTRQITGTPTFMMKKNVLEEIGGFEIVPMGQEYYLMHKVLQGNYKIGHCDHCYVKAYRTKNEAISTGKNKIPGEKAMYGFKKKYFRLLSSAERRYVRCRHYAVMAVAYRRNNKYLPMLWYLILAVLCSPVSAIKEAMGLNKRKKAIKS